MSIEAVLICMFFIVVCMSGLVIWLIIEVKAMQRSTHQVTYMDPTEDLKKWKVGGSLNQEFATLSEEDEAAMKKDPFGSIV